MLRSSISFFILLLLSSSADSAALRKANLRAELSVPNQIENCPPKVDDIPVLKAKTCKGTDEYVAGTLYPHGSHVIFDNNFFESLVDNTSDSPSLENHCEEADDCLRRSIHWIRVGWCSKTNFIS